MPQVFAGVSRAAPVAHTRRGRRLVHIHAGVTLGMFATALALYCVPQMRVHLYREGHAVETLSAVLFLVSSIVAVVAMRKARPPARKRHGLISILGLLCFLEEMSWGAWELGLSAPRVLGLTIDGVHDLPGLVLHVAAGGSTPVSARLIVVLTIMVIPLAVPRIRRWLARQIGVAWMWLPRRFLLMALGSIAVAQILDFVAIDSIVRRTLEEILELNGGVSLLFAAAASIVVEREEASATSD